jgi:hypothetical protein
MNLLELKKNSKSVLTDQLYCDCGFTGNHLDFTCPECKRKIDANLQDKGCVKFHTTETIDSNDTFTILLTIAFYKNKQKVPPGKPNFSFSKKHYEIELNKKRGVVFLKQGKASEYMKENYSYGSLQYKWMDDIKGIRGLTRFIITELFKARNIIDLEPSLFGGENFPKIFMFIKHPNLQYLGSHRVNYIPKDVVDTVDNTSGKIELFHKLIHHKSKRVIEKASHPDVFNFLLTWGKLITQPENVINFLNELTFYDAKHTNFFDKNDFEFHYFQRGISLIQKLHENQDEKIWNHRLLKAVKNGHYSITPHALEGYVKDIGRMYTYILGKKRDYSVNFSGDIGKLHDDLSADLQKVNYPNKKIVYSEAEQKLEKILSEKESFILAPDTHYLIEVGT